MFKINLTNTLILLLLIVIIHLGLNTTKNKLREQNMAMVSELQHETSIENARRKQLMQEQKLNIMQSQGNYYDKKPYKYPLDKIGNALLPIKNMVNQYEKKHGKWPENMFSLGMDPKQAGDDLYINKIKTHDGEIFVFLNKRFGNNKIIRLFHKPLHPKIWRCESNLKLRGDKKIAGVYCPGDPKVLFKVKSYQQPFSHLNNSIEAAALPNNLIPTSLKI